MIPIKHKGQIVERIVREGGYTLTRLAKRLNISRNTLYNKFNNPNLSFDFIRKVGEIISFDFSIEFPEMKRETKEAGADGDQYVPKKDFEYVGFMKEYFALAKQHRSLLEFLVKLANNNELKAVKEEIRRFVEASKDALLRSDSKEGSLSPIGEEPGV